jgi:hypothetical protein
MGVTMTAIKYRGTLQDVNAKSARVMDMMSVTVARRRKYCRSNLFVLLLLGDMYEVGFIFLFV